MNNISNKHIGWLACLLLTACQSEDMTHPDTGNTLQVEAVELESGEMTRGEVTSISEISVYATSDIHAELEANALSTYTNSGGTWNCSAPPVLTDKNTYIYAFYPAKNTVTNQANGNHYIPVEIKSTMAMNNNPQEDYLYADQTKDASNQIIVTAAHKAVSFSMKHALSKVSFLITKDASASETLTLTQLDIVSGQSRLQTGTGSMYLNNGQLVGLASGGQISLTGSLALPTSTKSTNVSTLVAPMSGYDKTLTFRLTVMVGNEATGRIFETGNVDETGEGVKWEQGVHYVYQIKVSKMGGIINKIAVYDWKQDSDQNTHVGI